ncbi:efflux RND transporter periplasmic adaptor subunit [Pseudoduganella aquatica]|uniref:efflux RND transporter periplasmic adaptor subunit n=1 Tax=Pseudoduganella aquatica TaxID=2660641 RepID=UPI001E5BEC9F|nr:efflux RND transporter periplasmic adaptor subunit [Pseudoduganella aquatica]
MSSLPSRLSWPRLAAAAALLAVAAAVYWATAPETLATCRPERGSVVDAVYAAGSVEPTVKMPIAPRVGGRLAERLADEGEQVRKGQVLARLDDADLAGTVDELRARAEYARSQHARIAALAERGFVAAGERERSRSELAAAEAALRRALAQRGYMALTAPADGTVIRRDGEPGQYIGPGQAVFVLACCAPLRVSADIDEEDINRVRVGQPVLLRAPAVPGTVYDGTVADITPQGDPVARSYRVRVRLAEPGALRPGMTVEANLIVARRENALLLPNSAVLDGAVWLLAQGRLQRRAVQLGIRDATRSEIVRGLAGDETVVLQPHAGLRQNRRARPAAR